MDNEISKEMGGFQKVVLAIQFAPAKKNKCVYKDLMWFKKWYYDFYVTLTKI